MCFSAPVSFATGAGLAAVGATSLSRAKGKERWFALIPILFSVQQIVEGLLWVTIWRGADSFFLAYAFLFFAFLLWPTYIPLLIFHLEKQSVRRSVLLAFVAAGIFVSLYLFVVLATTALEIRVLERHIFYDVALGPYGFGAAVYAAVVTGSALFSSDRRLQWFGAILLLSGAVAWLISSATFTSVWCFFAAVLSLGIYFYFRYQPSRHRAR